MEWDARARKYGLKHEKHFITTDDDYILQACRVFDGESAEGKIPIYIQHGLADSANGMLCHGDKR